MDSSVSPKDEIWFMRMCRHIVTGRRFGGTRHIYVQGTKQQTPLFAGTVQLRYCNLTILQTRTIFRKCIVSVCCGPPGLPPKKSLAAPRHPLAVPAGWGFLRGAGVTKRSTVWTTSLLQPLPHEGNTNTYYKVHFTTDNEIKIIQKDKQNKAKWN